jgi:hypothetical protein
MKLDGVVIENLVQEWTRPPVPSHVSLGIQRSWLTLSAKMLVAPTS